VAILDIEALAKSYRTGSETVVVLRDINLRVEEGTTVIITGESGSGKTTLLNLTGGLDYPTSGSIRIDGREISRLDEDALAQYRKLTVGFIFQFHFLLADFTAVENVMLPAMLQGANRSRIMDSAAELLGEVGMDNRLHHFPNQLSGGERQRVAVARALMNDPRIILADEPVGNLDERNSGVVIDLLFDLVGRHGKTLLLVTHDRRLQERADRSYDLIHGKLVES
jgi:lipoprotein-releasing system ATP-binding protein